MNPEPLESIEGLLKVEKVELVLGSALSVIIKDLEGYYGQSLPDYMRDKIAESMGWIMPEMKVSSSIELERCSCQIKINGYVASAIRILPYLSLAIKQTPFEDLIECLDAGDIFHGYHCVWVDRRMIFKVINQKGKILSATDTFEKWLLTNITNNAHDIFGFEELQVLIDYGNSLYPATLDAAIKNTPKSTILQVFRNLLEEGISTSQLESIFSSIAIHGKADCDSDYLTQIVRIALRNNICSFLINNAGQISVISIDSELEERILKQDSAKDGNEHLNANGLVSSIVVAVNEVSGSGYVPIVLTNDSLRLRISRLMRNNRQRIHVLGYSEIPSGITVETIYQIESLEQEIEPMSLPGRKTSSATEKA